MPGKIIPGTPSARFTLAVLFASVSLFFDVRGAEEFELGEVLIRYKPNATLSDRTTFEESEALILVSEILSIRVRLYQLPPGADVSATVVRFTSVPIVDFAEPNYHRETTAVSDPGYPLQWSLNNAGQDVNGAVGPADIDINWPEAMARFHGTTTVSVAVIDSGVALTHPDLFGVFFVNAAESNGLSGFDDDGNGYIDDYIGYDFFSPDVLAADENGHGTLVASIIAGKVNNGIGGAGISPNARIMALRVMDQFGRGGAPKYARVSDVAFALDYAGRSGARIVNLSLGGSAFSATEFAVLGMLSDAGVLIIAAAGNGGSDGIGDNNDIAPIYPASYSVANLMSVGAQDRTGGLASFSNYGATKVHLAAPGTDIYGADIIRRYVFAENFESGAPGWGVGSSVGNFSSDSWVIESFLGNHFLADHFLTYSTYLPYANTWVRSPVIDLRGVIGSRLVFGTVLSLADDYLSVELSPDAVNWSIFGIYSGANNGFATQQLDISDFDGLFCYVRFRLVTSGSNQGAGVWIDGVSVTAVNPVDSSSAADHMLNGTSFAAPLVSGVAALVMSQRPDLSAAQVKSVLLTSVRAVPALTGKVSTGGMLDAANALQMADTFQIASSAHSVDSNHDFRISLTELLRVIELYNTRNGTVRTGAYAVDANNVEDGFATQPTRLSSAMVTLAKYHSADSDHDGKFSLTELLRVIELYNFRSATVRTGQYHVLAGSEDGFAPGS
jgi:hypothetical protein